MYYACDFELFESIEEECILVEPLDVEGTETFGEDLADALDAARDWLEGWVDDVLLHSEKRLKTGTFRERSDASARHGGAIYTVFVERELDDIPSVPMAEASRLLGVSRERVTQLCKKGALDSWKKGSRRMVTSASIDSHLDYKDDLSVLAELDREALARAAAERSAPPPLSPADASIHLKPAPFRRVKPPEDALPTRGFVTKRCLLCEQHPILGDILEEIVRRESLDAAKSSGQAEP